MSLPVTEEQSQLKDTVRGWLADSYSLVEVRKVFEGKRAELTLGDLDSLGLSEAFTFDANGWGLRELAIVAFECGYALAPSSIHLNLLKEPRAKLHVAGEQVQLGSSDTKSSHSQQTLDRTQNFQIISSNKASSDDKNSAHESLCAYSMLCTEASGICARVIEMTRDYVTTRKQFGRAIGSFQAVQHKLADLFLLAEALRTTSEFAAWAGASSPEQFAFSTAAARSLAAENTPKVVEGCIQLHGGIGFTWEHDLHLFLRRAKFLQTLVKPDELAINDLLRCK